MKFKSCETCAARRGPIKEIERGDCSESLASFLCVRRGWLLTAVVGSCDDWTDGISMAEAILRGGTLREVSGAEAVAALARGECVNIDRWWYRVDKGRVCSLSPRGDEPRKAFELMDPQDLASTTCYIVVREASR